MGVSTLHSVGTGHENNNCVSLKLAMTPALCAALRQTYDRALKHQAGFIWTNSVESSKRSVNGP